MSDDPAPDVPVLRVISGHPSASEVAALVAVASALSISGSPREPERSQWALSARQGRRSPRTGPSAWRMSLRSG
ncbi:MAG: acyl-CoA carboxylase epsilon subunit [Candidatus Nanopelagicales bacterium]|nr:acyl-CoA carboxylase epsilon subunit [Candidatus Nanopelagicales bacterium]MDZ4250761.1 acyl-CoA carboxylase epsilon subunit [Candidatus Nanopelagicales bacterium]MDZ7577996.1 acyl-CoA carboxylase epsilon subunit [Candidatus Nanopelagicales bacterium]